MINMLFGILVPFLGTSAGAACVFLVKNTIRPGVQKALLGFASGVMVAASVWSLLIPAMDMCEDMGKLAFLPAACGFLLGMLFLGNLLVPIITGPALAPAFDNVTPALTGALAAPYFIKNKKLSIPTVAAACLLYLVLGYSFMSAHYSYFMLSFIVVSFLCYLLLYKVGYVKENPKR